MNRLVLRFLNAPILVLLTTVGIAVQTSLFAEWPLKFFQPDFALLVVIWCALHRDFTEGGILTLIFAEIVELHSAVPRGIFMIAYMGTYLCLRAADRLFVLPTQLPMIKVSMASAAAWQCCVMVLVSLLAHRALWKVMIIHLVPAAVIAGLVGVWVFRWLEAFDRLTFKNAAAENPDEFQIENLGL